MPDQGSVTVASTPAVSVGGVYIGTATAMVLPDQVTGDTIACYLSSMQQGGFDQFIGVGSVYASSAAITDYMYLDAGDQMILVCYSWYGGKNSMVGHSVLSAALINEVNPAGAALENSKNKARSEMLLQSNTREAPRD